MNFDWFYIQQVIAHACITETIVSPVSRIWQNQRDLGTQLGSTQGQEFRNDFQGCLRSSLVYTRKEKKFQRALYEIHQGYLRGTLGMH